MASAAPVGLPIVSWDEARSSGAERAISRMGSRQLARVYYVSGDYPVRASMVRRAAGCDRSDRAEPGASLFDSGQSVMVTCWRERSQPECAVNTAGPDYGRRPRNGERVSVQFQFSIGAHGASFILSVGDSWKKDLARRATRRMVGLLSQLLWHWTAQSKPECHRRD